MIGAKGMFLLAGYEGKGDGERMYHLITWGTRTVMMRRSSPDLSYACMHRSNYTHDR